MWPKNYVFLFSDVRLRLSYLKYSRSGLKDYRISCFTLGAGSPLSGLRRCKRFSVERQDSSKARLYNYRLTSLGIDITQHKTNDVTILLAD